MKPTSAGLSGLAARGARRYRRLLTAAVLFSRTRPWIVLAAATLLTALSVLYTIRNFDIQTNTTELLFHQSRIQKIDLQLQQVFPSLRDRIIVVIDGATPQLAQQAANGLIGGLRRHPDQFASIYTPGGEPFFRRNGLLYLSVGDLKKLSHQLVLAEPLLGRVAADPSLRGLFGVLDQIVGHSSSSGGPAPASLARIFDGLQASLGSLNTASPRYMDWTSLYEGGSLAGNDRRLVVLTLPPGADSPAYGRAALATIQTTAKKLHLDAAHGVTVAVTGSVILNLDQLAAVTHGARTSTILSLVLITLILVLGLRSAKLLFAVLLTLLLGLIWTSAFAVLAVGPFNLISVAFAVLFIGLGVDFGIQFCVRYQEEIHHRSDSRRAMHATATRMGPPLTLAALAAAASFYSVVPTGYTGIRDLGLIAGAGALIALVVNLTVLPALLTVLRAGRISIPRPPIPFERFPVHRAATPILLVAAALMIGSVFLLRRVSFDFNLARLQNQHSKAVRTLNSLEKTSPLSPYSIEALAPNLAAAEREAARVRKLSSVAHVVTLGSFVPDHQDEKLSILADTTTLVPPFALAPLTTRAAPDPAEVCRSIGRLAHGLTAYRKNHADAAAASGGRLAAALQSFRDRTHCAPPAVSRLRALVLEPLLYEIHTIAAALQPEKITLSSLPPDVARQYVAPDGVARISVFSSLNLKRTAALQRFVDQVQRVLPDAGGTPVLFVRGGRIVVSAFREATLIAIGLIVLIVFAVLRRPRNVFLTLIPLVSSVLLTLALMVIFHINFNLANIIVIPLTIGLSVAFGIYVIVRWQNTGHRITQVLKTSIPEGVLISGLTTLGSFGSLSISSDPAMASLGETLAIALSLILVNSLIVLPASLAFVERRRAARGRSGPPPRD